MVDNVRKNIWGLSVISNEQRYLLIISMEVKSVLFCSGCLGVMAMLFLSLVQGLHVVPAMLCLMAGSAGIAIADVTMTPVTLRKVAPILLLLVTCKVYVD